MGERPTMPSSKELERSIAALSDARVGVVGDVMADIYVSGLTQRVSREAPVVVVKHEREWLLPGGAANVAANVASLGATVEIVGMAGDDKPGRAVRQVLSERRVGTEGLLLSNQHQTVTKTRFLAGALHTSRQQVLRLDRGADGAPLDSLRALLRERVERIDERVDAWVVSDYGYGVFDARFKDMLRQFARVKTVVVDSRYDARSFGGVTVLKPNEEEAIDATSATDGSAEQMRIAARELVERLELQAVLITLGNQGMLLHDRGGSCRLIRAVGTDQIVDLTGAGDTVAAVLTAAMAAGRSALEAAHLANAAASIVVMREGVATVSPAELSRAIRESGVAAEEV
jgi:rfaE bifunctional protein kinase chain/domain